MAHRNQTRGAPPPDRAGEWTQLAATPPILNGMVPASDAELPSLGRSRSCSPMIFRVGSHVNFAGVHAGQNREKEMGLADLPIQLRHEKVVNPWSQAWGGAKEVASHSPCTKRFPNLPHMLKTMCKLWGSNPRAVTCSGS